MNAKRSAYLAAMVAALLVYSCDNTTQSSSNPPEKQQLVDTIKPANNLNDMLAAAMFDTVGVSTAPVRVTIAKLITGDHSNYKDIHLTWKNVGDKKIAAIRFSWYGLNAFGEPAEMGGNKVTGFGSGFVDRVLQPGKTDSGSWPIMSKDGKKIVLAWPYEVAFEDGTKWKSAK